MKSGSLQLKLLVLVILALGLPLAVALWSLSSVYDATEGLDRVSRKDFLAQETVLRATIRFKQQVQEWKDVLLRGADPAALDKHWNGFTAREAEVKIAVREAREAIPYEDLRAKLDQFLVAHNAAGEKYRAGLQAFKASGFDPHVGDKAVAGIDRPSTDLLLDAEKIARERGVYAVSSALASAFNAYRVAFAVTAVAVAVALVVVWLVIRRAIVEPVREAARFAARIGAGDLTGEIRSRSRDEIGQLLEGLAKMKASLTDIVRQMSIAAEAVAAAAAQVATGSTALSQQTEEQASSLEETAASMEELATTVVQNAAHARQADAVARDASRAALAGGTEVRNIVGTMGEISTEARRITDIVAVIDSIAFQTNILALNAAVEAARAGEQGRGFAVVAAEVRTLAQRSADAAKEIKGLIGRSSQKVEAGAVLVEGAAATIERLVPGVQEVSGIMTSIAESSAEQARTVQQINRTVTEMDKVIQHTASSVEQSAAAAEGMRRQAGQMVKTVSAFRLAEGPADELWNVPAAPLPGAGSLIARITARSLPRRHVTPALRGDEDWKEF